MPHKQKWWKERQVLRVLKRKSVMCFHVLQLQLKCCTIIKECDTLTCSLSQTSTHYCPCSSVFPLSPLLSISSLHVHLCWSLKLGYNGSLICFQFFCTTFCNIFFFFVSTAQLLYFLFLTTFFNIRSPFFNFLFIGECTKLNKMFYLFYYYYYYFYIVILLFIFLTFCIHPEDLT